MSNIDKKYTIYKIPYYLTYTKYDTVTDTIDNIVAFLKTDCQYHEKIENTLDITFSIDLDYFDDLETFKTNLIEYLSKHNINITSNDISYTTNYGKVDKNGNPASSHHISIPKLYASVRIMHLIWVDFRIKYNYSDEVDIGHVKKISQYLRLPLQTKEQKPNTEHKIIHGKLADFVLQYIHKDAFNMDATFNYLLNKFPQKTSKKPKKSAKSKIKSSTTTTCNINTPNNKIYSPELLDSYKTPDTEVILNLLKLLNPSRFDSYSNWIEIGMIIHSVYPIDEQINACSVWDILSRQSPKYEPEACAKYYNFKKALYTIKSLHYYARLDNPDKYDDIILNNNFSQVIPHTFESIKINKRYLTEDNEIMDIYNRFFINITKKCLSIKSGMDTGKSTLLTYILDKYNPSKVLFISFRKSLTYNIHQRLADYKFDSYLDKQYGFDKLIIQVESLGKLEYDFDLHMSLNRVKVPQYNLIIIDEVISVLNQFGSPTFAGKSREIFEYLEQLIKKSKKVISLDADYSNRSHDFLKNIVGEEAIITIQNTFVNNDRTLKFIRDREYFNTTIDTHLRDNKKIVIVSMASSEAEYYNETIKTKYPDKKIYMYIGDTDDELKTRHFKDINKYWSETDVIIYTATIEAGVDFNKPHFDKIFCILQSDVSSSQRSLLQMLFRVRQIKDKEVLVLNSTHIPYKNANFYIYDEVLDGLKNTLSNILQYKYTDLPDGETIRELCISNYDICQIYNKVENLNKRKTYFLPFLVYLAREKGYKIVFDEDITDNMIPVFDDKTSNMKINNILEAKDITDTEYFKLINKQKNSIATQENKLLTTRHYYKQLLGVSKLNIDIMKIFFKREYLIENFIYFIDSTKLPNYKDTQTEILHTRRKIVKSLLTSLGFTDIFNQTKYDYETFRKNLRDTIEKNSIFTDYKNSRVLFKLTKTEPFDFTNIPAVFKYINSILNEYCIKLIRINPSNKRQNAKNSTYSIIILYNVQEIIEYKMEKCDIIINNFIPIDEKFKIYKTLLS